MESYKTFGATGYKDTHTHVSSIALSKSLPNLTSTPQYGTQSMDTGLQELQYVPHKSRNEGKPFYLYFVILSWKCLSRQSYSCGLKSPFILQTHSRSTARLTTLIQTRMPYASLIQSTSPVSLRELVNA